MEEKPIKLNNIKTIVSKIFNERIEKMNNTIYNEYMSLQKQVKKIRNLLNKNNINTLDFSKLNKYYYLNKRIKTPNTRIKNYNISSSINLKNNFSEKKKSNNIPVYLNNKVLQKVLNIKKINPISHILIESKTNKRMNTIPNISNSPFLKLKYKENPYIDKNYEYKLSKNINFFKNIKKNCFNFNKIDYKNSINDNEEYITYKNYCLRGLTLTNEQNYYYQKCFSSDYKSFDKETINKSNEKDLNNINNDDNKEFTKERKGLKCKIINLNNREKQNRFNKKNNFILKYSLKNLINNKSPIKIKFKIF